MLLPPTVISHSHQSASGPRWESYPDRAYSEATAVAVVVTSPWNHEALGLLLAVGGAAALPLLLPAGAILPAGQQEEDSAEGSLLIDDDDCFSIDLVLEFLLLSF